MALKRVLENEFFEVFSIYEGWTILSNTSKSSLKHITEILENFKVQSEYLQFGGKKGHKGFGNKSPMTIDLQFSFLNKNFSEKPFLIEVSINGLPHSSKYTHQLDNFFEEDQVAIEIEWNNKDPFYHRDLNNLALLHQFECIKCGVIVTKASDWKQYGGSTTHYEKLAEFIHAGASRTCPIVVFAIKPTVIVETGIDLSKNLKRKKQILKDFKFKSDVIKAAKEKKTFSKTSKRKKTQ